MALICYDGTQVVPHKHCMMGLKLSLLAESLWRFMTINAAATMKHFHMLKQKNQVNSVLLWHYSNGVYSELQR